MSRVCEGEVVGAEVPQAARVIRGAFQDNVRTPATGNFTREG